MEKHLIDRRLTQMRAEGVFLGQIPKLELQFRQTKFYNNLMRWFSLAVRKRLAI